MAKYQPGRRLNDDDSRSDARSPFQRDRDRILYTRAFRRLGGTTQVASANESHRFHNRLTHTLEVAQIARRIAERLKKEAPATLIKKIGGLDADATEAAAFAHDLGHPPFGHIGEETLDHLIQDSAIGNDKDGYEGNAQSFRIVTRLAIRSADCRGLNLTCASLNGIVKYPWLRQATGKKHAKFACYSTEETIYEDARQGLPAEFRTGEAEIMDWADEIAYAVHDLYDFARAGLIPLDRIRESQAECKLFIEAAKARWARHGIVRNYQDDDLLSIWDVLQLCPLRRGFSNSHLDRANLRFYASFLVNQYVGDIELCDPQSNDGKCVKIGPQAKRELDLFKEFTWIYVIENPSLATIQYGEREILKRIFKILLEDAKDKGKLLPVWARELCEEGQPATRVVADVISSLTEDQAIRFHDRLTGYNSGSLLDPIVY